MDPNRWTPGDLLILLGTAVLVVLIVAWGTATPVMP